MDNVSVVNDYYGRSGRCETKVIEK
jgi:hypothetical protein